MAPAVTPDPRWRIAVTWDNAPAYLADPVDWTLGLTAHARTWATQAEASQVLWAFRRARAWRREFGGARVEPAPRMAENIGGN